jgi:hypothetical protein
MPFNIDTFKSEIEQNGYMKNNHFRVALRPPRIFNDVATANALSFRAESIKIPGVQILTADNNIYGVGMTQKQPYNSQLQDNSMTVLCDSYGRIWNFFYEWARRITNFNGQDNAVATYFVEYKDNYATTIQITTYDVAGEQIQEFNLFDAFPTSIAETNMNWGNSEVTKLNIGFSYSGYNIITS